MNLNENQQPGNEVCLTSLDTYGQSVKARPEVNASLSNGKSWRRANQIFHRNSQLADLELEFVVVDLATKNKIQIYAKFN